MCVLPRSPGTAALSWRAMVAVLRASVSRAIRLDWLHVSASLPGAAELPSWCVLSDRCRLTHEQFQDRWCLGAVLAHVSAGAETAGGPAALHVHVACVTGTSCGLLLRARCLLWAGCL